MKLTSIITQAQVIAGLNSFEGNAVDMSQTASSLAIFHQTLNSVNNDSKLNLVQARWDYNRDQEGEPIKAQASIPNKWINLPQLEEEEPAKTEDAAKKLFPAHATPFPISRTYPLPSNCRRVIKLMSGYEELRKTDYSEIEKNRAGKNAIGLYAVNNRNIELAAHMRASLVYVKEYPEYMPQDEVDLPQESLDYIINLLAYNLALSSSSPRVQMCQVLAEKSYNALLGNLRSNEGEKYLNVYTALNRFKR